MITDERAKALGPWAVALGVAIMLPVAFHAAFHCDEANVFRHVSQFAAGDFAAPGRPGLLWLMLTPLFGFEPHTAVIAARMAAVVASTVTLWAVWRLTLRAAGGRAAMAATVLLGTSMSWQAHSFEVRTDTFVAPVVLLGMLLLWRAESKAREAVLIGLMVAAAGLFSQKSIYNAGAMGAGWLVLMALRQLPRRFGVAIVASVVAVGSVLAWYGFLGWVNSSDDMVGTNVSRAAANAFENPRPVLTNLYAWGLAGNRAIILYAGLIPGAWVAWERRHQNGQLLAMAAAGLALASTIFYHRGFFMYFIASFEPYLAVCSGAGVVWVLDRVGERLGERAPGLLAAALVVFTVVIGGPYYLQIVHTSNAGQLRLMEDIADTFADPTPYWDGVGLVPGYPETTLFGTRANRERIRQRIGPAAFRTLAQERKPLMFVRNYLTRERYLEDPERVWVWSHFVPYRSNLYLRGGRVRVRAGETLKTTVEVVEPGAYTVHFWGGWQGSATVAGHVVRHRETIDLAVGEVELVADAASGSGQLWIMLGEHRQPYVETIDDVIDYSLYPMLTRKRFQQYDKPGREADLLTQATDPLLRTSPDSESDRRLRDHHIWQQMYNARMASMQQGEIEAPVEVDPDLLSPEEREDRALRQHLE